MDTLDTLMSMPSASVMLSPRLMLMLLLSTLLPMEPLDTPMLMDTLDTPLPTATESKKLELHSYLLKDFTWLYPVPLPAEPVHGLVSSTVIKLVSVLFVI